MKFFLIFQILKDRSSEESKYITLTYFILKKTRIDSKKCWDFHFRFSLLFLVPARSRQLVRINFFWLRLISLVGRPIPVIKVDNPSKEQIDALHAKYIQQLQELWEEWRHFEPDCKELILVWNCSWIFPHFFLIYGNRTTLLSKYSDSHFLVDPN